MIGCLGAKAGLWAESEGKLSGILSQRSSACPHECSSPGLLRGMSPLLDWTGRNSGSCCVIKEILHDSVSWTSSLFGPLISVNLWSSPEREKKGSEKYRPPRTTRRRAIRGKRLCRVFAWSLR